MGGVALIPHDLVRRVGGYREYAPPPDLAGCVASLWTFRTGNAVPVAHRVLPHMGVTVCLRWGEGTRGEGPEVLLFGPLLRVRWFSPKPGVALEAVELKPEWSRALLGVAPEEQLGGIVALSEVGRERVPTTLERAGRAPGQGLDALVSWLRTRAARARPDATTRVAHAALSRLRLRRDGSLRGAATAVGVSPRHLRRAVRTSVGVPPKLVHRLDRLNRVVAEADRVDEPAWAGLAVAHGYYDQAHLIREFREVAGATPRRVHTERRAQHVPFFQSGEDDPD